MKRTSILAASLMCSVMLSAQTREDAVLFSGGSSLDESYLLTENVSVVFDKDGKGTVYKGEAPTDLTFDGTTPVTAEFKDAFKLEAYQDPDNISNYYSTFYTSGGAYKVPETATAYAGMVEGAVLKMTDLGNIIHQKEAVILKATDSDITLMPSCNKASATENNILLGTDTEKTLGANEYAFSLGQEGIGFYLWNNQTIGAHKAYLNLNDSDVKAFTLVFDDATGIDNVNINNVNANNINVNLNGVRVNENYKGIVIKNGKKYLVK